MKERLLILSYAAQSSTQAGHNQMGWIAQLSQSFGNTKMLPMTIGSETETSLEIQDFIPEFVVIIEPNSQSTSRLCTRIRALSSAPILVILQNGTAEERIAGYDCGVDLYLNSPCDPGELRAALAAVARRSRTSSHTRILRFEGLEIDFERRSVIIDGSPISLTMIEFEVLKFFAENRGQVLDRETLFQRLAGTTTEPHMGRSIDVLVSRLRQKLQDDPNRPRFVRTVRHLGYTFIATPRA